MQIEPAAAQPKKSRHLQWLSLVVSTLLLLACGYFIYHRIDVDQILKILLSLDVKWLVVAIAIYWVLYPVTAYRFRYIFRWLKPPESHQRLPMLLIMRVTCSSGFVAVAAPVGLMADVAKIGAFRLFGGLSTTFATRCTLFDRAIAAEWMALLAIATFPLQWLLGLPTGIIAIQAAGSALVVGGVIGLLVLPKVLGFFRHTLISRIATMFSGYRATFQPRRLFVQLLFAACSAFIVWVTLLCLLKAAGLSADPWLVACFVPFLQLVNSVPFLYMGWGGREIGMAATLGTVSGLTLNQALAVSAAWGVALIIAGAVNAVFLIGNWSSAKAKHAK